MNKAIQRVGLVLDVPGLRLGCALCIGAIAWCFFLAQMMARLSSVPTPDRVPTLPLEMRAVIIDPPPVKPPETVQEQQPTAPSTPPALSEQPTLKPRAISKTKHVVAPPVHIKPDVNETPNAPALPPKESAQSARPPTNDPAVKNEAAPAAAPALTLGSTARALSQPLPVVPDDLRETAYRAEALARFSVHADGSVDVELLKPTAYPRLNQLLLEALHKWRFFPAMEGGHPIESQQDVRVHFNVN